jgi:hypothetical protein
VVAPLELPRYKVRIEIPHLSGTRGWSAAATAFEQGLAAQASLLVTERQIELVTRQGRDYVRVSATVEAGHVAEAAVLAWALLQQAMGQDADGWDIAGTSAEIRPARTTRTARLPKLLPQPPGPEFSLRAASDQNRSSLRSMSAIACNCAISSSVTPRRRGPRQRYQAYPPSSTGPAMKPRIQAITGSRSLALGTGNIG